MVTLSHATTIIQSWNSFYSQGLTWENFYEAAFKKGYTYQQLQEALDWKVIPAHSVVEFGLQKSGGYMQQRGSECVYYPRIEADNGTRIPKVVELKPYLERGVSILIFGNSGSGKSSVANYCIGEITSSNLYQVLALDYHLNDWGDIPIVYGVQNVIRQLTVVVWLMDKRIQNWEWQCRNLPKSDRRKNWFPFIVVWDEIGGTLAYANSTEGKKWLDSEILLIDERRSSVTVLNRNELDNELPASADVVTLSHPSTALLRLGSELRKWGGGEDSQGNPIPGYFIGMNQSGNCLALGIDSNYRSNFVDIHLAESALKQAESWSPNDPKNRMLLNPERSFVESFRDGYPCVIMDRPAVHPTHGHYLAFREGLKPKNIRDARLSPLTIPTVIKPLVFNADPTQRFVQNAGIIESDRQVRYRRIKQILEEPKGSWNEVLRQVYGHGSKPSGAKYQQDLKDARALLEEGDRLGWNLVSA